MIILGARGPLTLVQKQAEQGRAKAKVSKEGATVPRMPSWLSSAAKAEWRRVAKPLFDKGLFTELDKNTLALYCETWARYLGAQAVLVEQGETYEAADGTPKRRPESIVVKDCQLELRAMIALFGLSPSARMRMDLASAQEPADPMADLLD